MSPNDNGRYLFVSFAELGPNIGEAIPGLDLTSQLPIVGLAKLDGLDEPGKSASPIMPQGPNPTKIVGQYKLPADKPCEPEKAKMENYL